MSTLERIRKEVKRQQVSKPDSDPNPLPVEYENDYDNFSWNLEELQGNRNEDVGINSPSSKMEPLEISSEGGNTNTSKYPTEVEGFSADASEGVISFVPIPPSTTTINTTTLL